MVSRNPIVFATVLHVQCKCNEVDDSFRLSGLALVFELHLQ